MSSWHFYLILTWFISSFWKKKKSASGSGSVDGWDDDAFGNEEKWHTMGKQRDKRGEAALDKWSTTRGLNCDGVTHFPILLLNLYFFDL